MKGKLRCGLFPIQEHYTYFHWFKSYFISSVVLMIFFSWSYAFPINLLFCIHYCSLLDAVIIVIVKGVFILSINMPLFLYIISEW